MADASRDHVEEVFTERTQLLEAFRANLKDAQKKYAANGDLMPGCKAGRVTWFDRVTLREVQVQQIADALAGNE